MKRKIRKNSDNLFNEAKEVLVGGVNSPVRSFSSVGSQPLFIKKGRGSKVYDYNGREYIDYVLAFGALILGHAHKSVIHSIEKSIKNGLCFGATNKGEIHLAQLIQKAIPGIEKIRFVNSGTEAVIGAIRLARGYTARDKIVKFAKSYHGHADYMLVDASSGLSSLKIPLSRGVPKDFIKHTIIVKYGDISAVDRVFEKYGSQIAAVITEPVGGNYGVVPPYKYFLKHLRKITKKHKALLIFDEVITGFRFSFGSAADFLGIQPDLFCLGKIIGGGLPIGAFGGKKEIMDKLAPLGKVYQASTFAGHPVVVNAGIATLDALARLQKKYAVLSWEIEALSNFVEQQAIRYGIDVTVVHFGSMFSFKFKEESIFKKFYRALLKEGIYFAPSQYEANFVSFAHTNSDIDKTKESIKKVFKGLHKKA